VKIRDLLQKNGILIGLESTDKKEILSRMARYMASIYHFSNGAAITRKILEREADMSTGIGFGIAIPHARVDSVEHVYLIAAQSINGIDFNAIDEQPVHLLFMIISPINASAEHTHILSTLSRIMSYENIRKKLIAAKTAEQFLELIIKGEDKYVE
jgi:mannitol/fructose-specific phosphotransferase system IIA component (Ntr-type)